MDGKEEGFLRRIKRRIVGSKPVDQKEAAQEGSSVDATERARREMADLFRTNPEAKSEGVDAVKLAESISKQEAIDLEDLSVGDIAWWTTHSGSSYYYLVQEKCKDAWRDRGLGTLRRIKGEGEEMEVVEYPNSEIMGSSPSGELRMFAGGRVIKGLSVLIRREKDRVDKTHLSTSFVTSLGVIPVNTRSHR